MHRGGFSSLPPFGSSATASSTFSERESKPCHVGSSSISSSSSRSSNIESNKLCEYVEHHDGRRFWSDRFYLNSVSAEPSSLDAASRSKVKEERENYQQQQQSCQCGSECAPPSFPLVEFVNSPSLDLQAAVMGTFSLQPEWFREKFRRFGKQQTTSSCDSDSPSSEENARTTTIPTLIFHGSRGLEKALEERVEQAAKGPLKEYQTGDSDNDGITKSSNSYYLPSNPLLTSSSKFQFYLPRTAKATETAKHFVGNPNLQLCQVQCQWETKAARRKSVVVDSLLEKKDKNQKNGKSPEKRKKATNGVHHPKFLLLFERSGDLIVIVTTRNLSPQKSTVEGSWIQRFRRRRTSTPSSSFRRQTSEGDGHKSNNDFGPVLQDFLIQLSKNVATKQRNDDSKSSKQSSSPLEIFLSKHIGIKSLKEFQDTYHFETARAYLVPVVPGNFEYNAGADCTTSSSRSGFSQITRQQENNNNNSNHTMRRLFPNKRNQKFYYGRQRVRYILDTMAKSIPKISKQTTDKNKSDRLLLQPTSLGSNWSRSQFASLVREYMGYYNNTANNDSHQESPPKKQKQNHHSDTKNNKDDHPYYRDDFWVCRQADIIWPTDRYMVNAATAIESSKKSNSTTTTNTTSTIISPLQAAATSSDSENKKKGRISVLFSVLFNSSKSFNACDVEFLRRMAKFQPNTPCQWSISDDSRHQRLHHLHHKEAAAAVVPSRVPHFKSIARLFRNHVAMEIENVPPADAYFSWFLLTSACLSLGAQGSDDDAAEGKNGSSSSRSKVSYRNFELGVLFTSHLPRKKKSKRQSVVYCFHPHKCSCRQNSENYHHRATENNGMARGRGLLGSSSKITTPQLIHLPVPYQLQPESYFQNYHENTDDDTNDDDDDDDVFMTENPFFHEISKENRCIGNMQLTPFGQRESQM